MTNGQKVVVKRQRSSRSNENNEYLAKSPEGLLSSQLRATRVVLNGFSAITLDALGRGYYQPGTVCDADQWSANGEFSFDRPHNVFLLDGGRGAGKTFTLSSIQYALDKLTEHCNGTGDIEWQNFFLKGDAGVLTPTLIDHVDSSNQSQPNVAETIRVIFPGEFLAGESLMEAIFSHMRAKLNAEVESRRAKAGPLKTGHPGKEEQVLANLEQLQKRLQEEVARGFYFANRFGVEAVIRDSMDYRDASNRYAEELQRATLRIDAWRALVNDYLNLRNSVTLVVLIDDSDVEPELTDRVLNTIRMYLTHPRIITVMAGNLKSMRDSLLFIAMKNLAPAVPALNSPGHPTAKEWRYRARRIIEEYLEKVLPQAKRVHVRRIPQQGHANDETDIKARRSDFAKVAGNTLSEYCEVGQSAHRTSFLAKKFDLAIEHELGEIDAPNPGQRRSLENFIAWWFFDNIYKDALAPRSPRQIATFAEYYQSLFASSKELNLLRQNPNAILYGAKRLPVVLFDNSENHALTQRLNDDDHSVPGWLRTQELKSNWHDRRYFDINRRQIDDGSFTHQYLLYRLDVGLAMPVRDNTDSVVPPQLIPDVVGRKFMRRFFQPKEMPRRNRRLGVGRVIDHAAIPSNCVYFHDLRALPDLIFVKNDPTVARTSNEEGEWEASLADRWLELIEDRETPNDDVSLKKYFREVVCEALKGTGHISSAALISELDPPDLLRKQELGIYEHFLRDEIGSLAASSFERRRSLIEAPLPGSAQAAELEVLIQRIKTETINEALSLTEDLDGKLHGAQWPPRAPRRMIALYTALVTDLRRAWLATRVYEAYPQSSGSDTLETGQRPSLAILANRDRMTLLGRDALESLLDRSPWVREMRKVFDKRNLEVTFKKHATIRGELPKEVRDGHAVPKSSKYARSKAAATFLDRVVFASKDVSDGGIQNKLQAEAEPKDFSVWTQTLRWFGRELCKDWPVVNVAKKEQPARKPLDNGERERSNESTLFNRIPIQTGQPRDFEPMLKIFDEKKLDGHSEFDATSHSDESQDGRQAKKDPIDIQFTKNARSARNFVWLMYGIAPSLPALIHAHIMSRVYEAEILWKADTDPHPAPSFPRNAQELSKRALAFYDSEDEKQLGALQELERWAELIGSIAMILRYIKIKCLHLDVALMLDRISYDEAASTEQNLKNQKRRQRILKKFNYTFHNIDADGEITTARPLNPESIERVSRAFAESLKEKFNRDAIRDGLAIFPDVSPSTLFGDGWFEDILSREAFQDSILDSRRVKEAVEETNTKINKPSKRDFDGENPLSVTGIFGETEQWLWSANRTIRKLNEVLQHRKNYLKKKAKRPQNKNS